MKRKKYDCHSHDQLVSLLSAQSSANSDPKNCHQVTNIMCSLFTLKYVCVCGSNKNTVAASLTDYSPVGCFALKIIVMLLAHICQTTFEQCPKFKKQSSFEILDHGNIFFFCLLLLFEMNGGCMDV